MKSGDVVFWKPCGKFCMDENEQPRRFAVWNIRRKYATIESEELYIQGLTYQKINVLISELEAVENQNNEDAEMKCAGCKSYYHMSGACCTIPSVNRCTQKKSPKYGDLLDLDGCSYFDFLTPTIDRGKKDDS